MLDAADTPLYAGCDTYSQLSWMTQFMSIKTESHMSERTYNQMSSMMKAALPEGNNCPEDFYSTKRNLRGLGLPVEKIDCCVNNCMLYWGETSELHSCMFCDQSRYKDSLRASGSRRKKQVPAKQMHYFPLTPRLQRLFASPATAEHMRWHATSTDDGIMRHPADSPAWKHLNSVFPGFADEIRNVRLGLSTDGFAPFAQSGRQYSSWPVIVTPYNLPPWLCMKEQFMFLTVLVPGPSNPKMKLDVFLQPLIHELKSLWEVGVNTYDISLKQNFQMRAALIWTISDFPAYAMLSGWGTAGKLACPHCMENTEAFTLPMSGKQSWFDNHRKFLPPNHVFRRNKTSFLKNKTCNVGPPEQRSGIQILNQIEGLGFVKVTEDFDGRNAQLAKYQDVGWKKKSIFWDLPYWRYLLIRHNLDVMHIEKNVFDNVFNTVLNVKGKTKDTEKSREELNTFCKRKELKKVDGTRGYPKACYTLDREEKKILLQWIKSLKFPDGYVSNISRCVDMNALKMHNMKSHDCHVFMQILLPVAFKELLPKNVWEAITELSFFFRELTSRNVAIYDMRILSEKIDVTLCKLERIFPPSLFDSMEHLPVHLADEARLAGPVQYRWMYPFERYLRTLKNHIKNKAKVEASIANAYLHAEMSTFSSFYFEDQISTKWTTLPRNIEMPVAENDDPLCLAIFKPIGRSLGRGTKRYMDEREWHAAHMYILSNCAEVAETYSKIFKEEKRYANPYMTDAEFEVAFHNEFILWFNHYVCRPCNDELNPYIRSLAAGPLREIETYSGYFVNGYRFHTTDHDRESATVNSGVCIKGSVYGSDRDVLDFYGRLQEVCVLEYPGYPIKQTVLFNCEWFDLSAQGTSIDTDFKLVSLNHTRRYRKYDPFVLASQVVQVFYCPYPSTNQSKKNWWSACKVNARSKVEVSTAASTSTLDQPFQEEVVTIMPTHTSVGIEQPLLLHPLGGVVEIEDDDEAEDDDSPLTSNDSDDDSSDAYE
ncbi:uncharacterized protein LOC130993686 [Salvia miltiorrhiza]|uniref:uncharacterized protein LOC130993686 n=2 Tax=Salvia miltiorrhiza TaxID=226208 RepID=UPI0025AD5553|nr:uncharacterized protein LOC130993686 [Salvia miltiorrhiza]